MTKLYQKTALWPLLDFNDETLPFRGSLDPYGDGEVKYIADDQGVWLLVLDAANPDFDFEAITGFCTAELEGKKIGDRYVYGMSGGTPLLPFPFTASQLWDFDRRAGGVVYENVERGGEIKTGSDSEGWVDNLWRTNQDAAELARVVLSTERPAPCISASASAVVLPVQRATAQELEVLNKLRELGYHPRSLPPAPEGKQSSAKTAVKQALPHMTAAIFKKAWQRLRDAGEIVNT